MIGSDILTSLGQEPTDMYPEPKLIVLALDARGFPPGQTGTTTAQEYGQHHNRTDAYNYKQNNHQQYFCSELYMFVCMYVGQQRPETMESHPSLQVQKNGWNGGRPSARRASLCHHFQINDSPVVHSRQTATYVYHT